ncbi:MAG: carbohydrate porin [Elusimicrobiota bacterium]|jgi:hypothetical protein|nr:carbohydrate porin [Elusimicrobiota bacterium]
MKKISAAVSAVLLFSGAFFCAANAQSSVAEAAGIQISIDGNVYVGGSSTKAEDKDAEVKNAVNYGANIAFTKEVVKDGSLVLQIRGGDADTIIELGKYRGGTNDNAYGHNGSNDAWIKYLYYTQGLFDNKVSITFGKADALSSANDAGASVGSFFTNDATVDILDTWDLETPYTVLLSVSPIDILSVSYSYSTQNSYPQWDSSQDAYLDPFKSGFNAIEVKLSPIKDGNYRIGYWSSNQPTNVYKEGGIDQSADKTGASGFWLSFDQSLNGYLTLFVRFGTRFDKTMYGGAGTSFQGGAKIPGASWSRDNDYLFLGVGQASNIKDITNKDYSELHFEINYSFALNANVSLVPNFQYVSIDADGKIESGYAAALFAAFKF